MTLKLSRRERIVFSAAAGLVLLFTLDKFVGAPALHAWAGLNHRLAAEEIKLRRYNRLLQNRDKILGEYKSFYPPGESRENDGEEATRFLKQVESLARKCAVKITDSRPGPGQPAASVTWFLADLKVQGPWGSLARFIWELQNASPPLQIEQMTVGAGFDGESDLKARFLMKKGVPGEYAGTAYRR